MASDLSTYFIHSAFADPLLPRGPKIAHDSSASPLGRLISHAWYDMEMHMRVLSGLCELNDVCFSTSDYTLQ